MQAEFLSYHRVLDTPSDHMRFRAEQCGYAVAVMSASKTHMQYTMAYVLHTIEPSVRQKRIKFYFNEDGQVVGYVIWAFLVEDVAQRVRAIGRFALHESEWNEGVQPWIVDFLVPFGNLKYVLRDLRDSVFSGYAMVNYLRVRRGNIHVGTFRRDSRARFFHATGELQTSATAKPSPHTSPRVHVRTAW